MDLSLSRAQELGIPYIIFDHLMKVNFLSSGVILQIPRTTPRLRTSYSGLKEKYKDARAFYCNTVGMAV